MLLHGFDGINMWIDLVLRKPVRLAVILVATLVLVINVFSSDP